MARRSFGGTAADFLADTAGNVESGGTGTVWTAQTGGTQITDLLTAGGSPTTTLTAATSPEGMVQFQGPDDGTAVVWIDFGAGRVKVVSHDGFAKAGRMDDSTITSARTSAGTEAAGTVFTGDFSSTLGSAKLTLSGTALPSPASGYKYTPEATAHYVVLVNSTGHNESLSANSGRTAATAYRTMVWHTGQGDSVAYNAYVEVDGTPQVGSTHWLANAAGTILNGQVELRQDHLYGNPVEINIGDNGHDGAGIGAVFNLIRTVGTASQGEVWMGVRVQSIGSSAADVGFSISGAGGFKRGLDLVRGVFDSDKAAVTIKADDRVYLNSTAAAMNGVTWYSTSVGTEYLDYNSTLAGVEAAVKGKTSLLVTATSTSSVNYIKVNSADTAVGPQIISAGTDANVDLILSSKGTGNVTIRTNAAGTNQVNVVHTASANRLVKMSGSNGGNPYVGTNGGDLDLQPATGFVRINGTQVLAPRVTGYTAMTGTANKATVYDTATVTLAQLAGRVMQLQADLTTHGLIGA